MIDDFWWTACWPLQRLHFFGGRRHDLRYGVAAEVGWKVEDPISVSERVAEWSEDFPEQCERLILPQIRCSSAWSQLV